MKSARTRDQIYARPLERIVDFEFDEAVAGVFPDMIQRSVPGYSTIIAMTGIIAGQLMQAATRCYDLGCSVGAATLAMRSRIQQPDCKIIAVDNSEAMLARARNNLDESMGAAVEFVCDDIRAVTVENASLVVMNYTLQFVPPEQRDAVIRSICQGLNPGGALVLSEKIAFDDPQTMQTMTDLHHAFKRANGYSDLEISQKRTALENVLVPETLPVHQQRLEQAGFSSVQVWFQCFNFVSLLAIK